MKYLILASILVSSLSAFATCKEEMAEGSKVDIKASVAGTFAKELELNAQGELLCQNLLGALEMATQAAETSMASQTFYHELKDKETCDNGNLQSVIDETERNLSNYRSHMESLQLKIAQNNC